MHIIAFHIDGFGIFHDTGGEGLSPNLNIFYGKNEAGKSTCLEFFRTMLTGYPDKNSRRLTRRTFEPLRGGHPGGNLALATADGELYLNRAPAPAGGLSLHTAGGTALHAEHLLKLLGGATREVYARIFGFSLEELESWDKMNDESFRNALYGATFGPGLISPREALARIEREMAKIFKPRGTTQPLSLELNKLASLRQDIRALEEKYGKYDSLVAELQQCQKTLQALREEREQLDQERARLERKTALRQQWQQWSLLKDKLSRLEQIPAGFPENAVKRLADLETECNGCERSLAGAAENMRQLQNRHDSIRIDGALVAIAPLLRTLTERKSSYRKAMNDIPALEEGLARVSADLDKELSLLGPGWSCERISKTDRSLFARENIEQTAKCLDEARMRHQAALDTLQRANLDVDATRKEIDEATQALENLPEPEAILDGYARDELRSLMRRLEDTERDDPSRRWAVETCERTLQRTLAQLGIADKSVDYTTTLENLSQNQEDAKKLAQDIQQALDAAKASAEIASRAEAEVETLQARLGRLGEPANSASPREALNTKMTALRSLRTLAPAIAAEEERKKEYEARIAQEKKSPELRNWALLIFGIFFLVAAGAIFVAHWFFGLNSLVLGEGLAIPLNLWAAYAALVCGVVLCGSGYSANNPEKKRRKLEMEGLLARSEASSMKLADLSLQCRQLCAIAGLDSVDPIDLDAMEVVLEGEKEKMLDNERSAKEQETVGKELERAMTKARDAQLAARESESAVQQSRRAWHEFMRQLGLSRIPAAESAEILFDRLKDAIMARENLAHAQQELDTLWSDLHKIEQAIMDMPPVKQCLENAENPLSLKEAVDLTLEKCRNADKVREERKRLEATRTGAQAGHESANARQKEAIGKLEEASTSLEESSRIWARHMNELGLDENLTPETVRQAFRHMDNCLQYQKKLCELKESLLQANKELEAMENPLQECLQKLDKQAKLGPDHAPDWVATLEELDESARKQERFRERQEDLARIIDDQKAKLATQQAELEKAQSALKAFLSKGATDSIDRFLELASLRDEQRALAAKREELETILAHGARGEPFDEFLAGFEKDSPEALDKRLARTNARLLAIAEEERETAASAGALKANTDALVETDKLADLRQEAANSAEICTELAEKWQTLALAKEIILQARHVFEQERQPAIIQIASHIFAAITGGRWSGLSLNLEDASLRALDAAGEAIDPVNLSRGTQEQAYLALRLAYIEQHARQHEALPVIMDEIMVNFDPERAGHTAAALADFSATNKQQILYFTCQPHMVELLKSAFVAPALFEVENGRILAA